MHPNVRKGQRQHEQHFESITKNGSVASGWQVWSVNKPIPGLRIRPDWVLINESKKRIIIVDLTTKYDPKHYKKGQQYQKAFEALLDDDTWDIVYLEDYWLDATIH